MTTKTWNGSTADWYTNDGGDWSPPGDPGSSDAVVINSGEAQLVSGDAAISVASISIGGSGFLAIQDPGATQSVGGNVTVSGSGLLELDGIFIGGAGGSSLTIGGNLSNSSTSNGGVSVGNTGITSADTLTVNGTGGLSNTGTIDIEGGASVQATLDVANAAAGFGTVGTETGNVFLENDALLEFQSGQITTIDGTLQLDGANARVADAGKLTTNSALTGLATVSGDFYLQNGATVAPTGNVSVTGSGLVQLDGIFIDGAGGTSLTIGGNLSNSSTSNGGVSVGNTGITSTDTLTVNGTGGLSNTGTIDIEGGASVQATLDVANAAAGFGTVGTETGNVFLENDALLEFQSGQITTIDGTLQLDGANARVADAGKLTTNSALTGLATVSGDFYLQNGATVAPTGNVSVTGSGLVQLDGIFIDGAGGTSLTIGGNLSNSSTGNGGVSVGNTGITSTDTLTVNGTGGLSNTGTIDIEGGTSVQATLDVANAAAGFGTVGTETGNVFLENDALLEFQSGQITTIDGTLQLDGANARVADAGKLTTNSALTGLATVSGDFYLQNGATVAPTGNVSVTGSGLVQLDGIFIDGAGGTSLTIGGNLSNSSTSNGGVSVGNTGITSADTLTVNGTGGLSNTGTIDIEGGASVQATLDVANAAAGFGTVGTETGNVFLENDALLEFKSGQITTIDGTLQLDGANARVADAGKLTTNSALTGLATVSGDFYLQNGATVAPTGNVSVTGSGLVQLDGIFIDGAGGTSLTIGGNLSNSSTSNGGVSVGNTGITSADTLTVNGTGGLSNTGTIDIEGGVSVQATLDVANAAAGFGTKGVETGNVFLENDALLEFKSGQITTIDGTLQLDGANARVASGTKLTTNSALTGLATVAGDFFLENGAKISPTGNVTISGSGSLQLDGVGIGGGGGSSLTIGGTLTNNSTNGQAISIGNTGITSADTLTVNGAGGLSNTGVIIIEGGSASAIGTLDVKDTATSSGTIVIDAFGDLTATTVDITGGTLEGVGTVTGTLNETGGTVVGGSLDGNTGTLTDSGAYKQSGSGVLQTDINTGDSQQSSIIAVTGSPGTPGAKGSVNLAGGALLIEGESNLALNTPYTVMTFAANDLYGQFGEVETEGSLGSHTGNSNSVNVGGGETLEVLYNEASGDVQVELVTTPASTTYTWDVGSGTWNALSAADWNPPGTGTTPSATSNVTIGTGGGGTVTLAQDQTINSLSITNGYALSGASNSISVNGNVSVASGAVLSIDDMNVDGAFTDSGSLTFKDTLTINSGGSLTLSNGSLSGGINGTGTFESSGSTDTLTNVTINSGTTYTASNGVTTDIQGTIAGKGTLQVNGGGGNNGILQLIGATTLSGGGTVSLTTATGGGAAFFEGNGETLTNAGDVIEGTGTLGNGSLAVINGGTIDANSSTGTKALILNGTGGITNANGATAGLMEATSGGTLQINGITVNNKGGTITANGGTVEVINATIEGGTLNTLGGGTLESAGSDATLNGTTHGALTISAGSAYTASNGVTTDILGAITDKGTIQIDGGSGNNGILTLTAGTTLSGGGTVSLTTATGGGNAFVEGNSETLTNSDVIEGTGEIGNGSLAVINGSTIDANSSAGTATLILNGTGGITNANGATAGLLEATDDGTLQINGITVNNAGGAITANGGGVQVLNATIQGGTLNTQGGGTMESAGSDATLDGKANGALTISTGSTYTASDGVTTDILGTIPDKGAIQLNGGSGSNGILNLTGAVTLGGGGVVAMTTTSGGGAPLFEGNSETLTSSDVIEGTGTLGNGSLAVTNSGTIEANVSAGTLILNGSGGVTNTNVIEATSGGTLQINGITVNNAGGAVTANDGVVQVINATIQGGTLNTTGGGTMESAGSDATLDGKTNGALTISTGSTYTASNGVTTDILGAITDKDTIQVNGGSGNNGILTLTGATTLSGGGMVTMTSATGGGAAFIDGNDETLTNSDVIEGTGEIGNGSLAVINGSTIDANSSAGTATLILNGTGGITNANGATAGLLEATSSGTVQINSITVNNAGGAITANGGSVQVLNATIQGGTLNTLDGGTMASAGSDATLDGTTNGALTISTGSTYTATNGVTTDILGTITDKGAIQVNGGSGNNGIVDLTGATTLSGGGTVSLTTASGGGNAFIEGNSETLTNADVIEGTGIIGNGSLALTSSGTIDANVSGGTLTLNGSGALTNTGVFEATAGGHLDVADALSGAGQLEVGANSTVELGGATSESTTFLSATSATLLIDNATTTTYTGVLSSFVEGDILELGNTDATSATPTSFNGTNTTLTVDLSSGGPLVYTLAGNYTGDTFKATPSGSNSDIVITADPAFDEAFSLLGGHTASPFAESSGVVGASNSGGSAELNLAASLHAHS